MDRIRVEGGHSLRGKVTVSGSKNAVLPILVCSLLTDEPVTIRRVPNLRDVVTLGRILDRLGVKVDFDRAAGVMSARVVNEDLVTAPWDLVSTMRASICVLGPLLAKRGRARVSMPGGCVFGVRPIDLHLKGLAALGAQIEVRGGYVEAECTQLRGAEVYLGSTFGSTVLGTANVMMAATLAAGETLIENAAMEPEVQDLGRVLIAMGAKIDGLGTHQIRVQGVKRLGGFDHAVIGDRIEAGTFLVAGAITGGDVEVGGVEATQLLALLERLAAAGVKITRENGTIRAQAGALKAIDVTTLPHPGFPTDLQAQVMALLTVADGISVITEKVFPDRFIHVAELNRMGARIRKEGPMAIVSGVRELSGAPVMASDLRASAALLLAGVVARGETEVHRVYHIDRGYERIDRKLSALGAKVRRVSGATA
ncbi:MAG: UDP-N-acetylglucosamine 1-carboxyvinyltransferase [Planctomycetota bacterium]